MSTKATVRFDYTQKGELVITDGTLVDLNVWLKENPNASALEVIDWMERVSTQIRIQFNKFKSEQYGN